MEDQGVDMQVLSAGNPWVDIFGPVESVSIAKTVNDEISKVIEKKPDKFIGLATLPFNNPGVAVEELERTVKHLGFKGVIAGSNIRGKPLSSHEFLPIYEKAVQLDVPIVVHPTTPAGYEAMQNYSLVTLLGYPFDTTVSICNLIFSGIFEKIPNLKIVASHLDGTLPYLAGRIDMGYRAIPECKVVSEKHQVNILNRFTSTR